MQNVAARAFCSPHVRLFAAFRYSFSKFRRHSLPQLKLDPRLRGKVGSQGQLENWGGGAFPAATQRLGERHLTRDDGPIPETFAASSCRRVGVQAPDPGPGPRAWPRARNGGGCRPRRVRH